MPTNLYGPGDNYHPENSHVIPALIRRFHEAKINNEEKVIVWGSGNPKREFLYVDDMASASVHVMNLDKETYDQSTNEMCSHINVGAGKDMSIGELAKTLKKVIGFDGKIEFDSSKPDGSPRKLMDSSRLNSLGWTPKVKLEIGLTLTYENYLQELQSLNNKQ